MKHIPKLLIILLFLVTLTAQSQHDQPFTVEEHFDHVTSEWLAISEGLSYYGNLGMFCDDPEYRSDVLVALKRIHHYDSLILDILKDPTSQLEMSHHAYKQTIRELGVLETDYSIKAFVAVLKEACRDRNNLERDKEDLQKESGIYSYDGQVLMLETELSKYLKHLDKKILSMQDHIHNIHPDQLSNLPGLVRSE